MNLKRPCTVAHILALAEIIHTASLDSKIRKQIAKEKLGIRDIARIAKQSQSGAALYKLVLIAESVDPQRLDSAV